MAKEMIISRKRYKEIRRMDHQQMARFMEDLLRNHAVVSLEKVLEVAEETMLRALDETKGIGPKTKEAFLQNFKRLMEEEDAH
ncbi:MAG: hypothetical protein Q4A78_07290 [Peptostreptococcaceae bacterium]|nr:hypothetical protein [Peptostreptococcaceae bacterium]